MKALLVAATDCEPLYVVRLLQVLACGLSFEFWADALNVIMSSFSLNPEMAF